MHSPQTLYTTTYHIQQNIIKNNIINIVFGCVNKQPTWTVLLCSGSGRNNIDSCLFMHQTGYATCVVGAI